MRVSFKTGFPTPKKLCILSEPGQLHVAVVTFWHNLPLPYPVIPRNAENVCQSFSFHKFTALLTAHEGLSWALHHPGKVFPVSEMSQLTWHPTRGQGLHKYVVLCSLLIIWPKAKRKTEGISVLFACEVLPRGQAKYVIVLGQKMA